MKQILRYSLVALLAMVFAPSFAEDIIWQEDWAGCDPAVLPTNTNYAFTGTVFNDDGSIKSGTKIYDANLAGGEAPELLVAKNGGSFTATVDLAGKSGDMTLTFKTNRSDLTVSVEGATLGEKSRSGNDDTYTISGASGTLKIIFTQSTSSNARLDNIKLFQGQGKKPAGLSWGTSARTVTIGADDNIFPTLSNENNLAVTYDSSDKTVATIAADGTITLIAAGSTVISASSEETAEFEAGHAQYTLTVKDAQGGGGGEQIEQITVARALEIAGALADNGYSDKEYQIKGFVVGTPAIDKKSDGSFYGNAKFYMADTKGGSETIYAYQIYGLNGENMTSEDYLKENDEVIVQGKLQKYVKNETVTLEIAKGGKIVSLNGTTGINTVKANQQNGAVYNVAGQMVTDSYKGLVIKNGKKFVNK